MDAAGMLAKQVLSLAWLRCCMEEGVNFTNKHTGKIESDEKVVFDNLEKRSGAFDVPNCQVSPFGLEKNILEVVGSYTVYTKSPGVREILFSESFATNITEHIQTIRRRKKNA